MALQKSLQPHTVHIATFPSRVWIIFLLILSCLPRLFLFMIILAFLLSVIDWSYRRVGLFRQNLKESKFLRKKWILMCLSGLWFFFFPRVGKRQHQRVPQLCECEAEDSDNWALAEWSAETTTTCQLYTPPMCSISFWVAVHPCFSQTGAKKTAANAFLFQLLFSSEVIKCWPYYWNLRDHWTIWLSFNLSRKGSKDFLQFLWH